MRSELSLPAYRLTDIVPTTFAFHEASLPSDRMGAVGLQAVRWCEGGRRKVAGFPRIEIRHGEQVPIEMSPGWAQRLTGLGTLAVLLPWGMKIERLLQLY